MSDRHVYRRTGASLAGRRVRTVRPVRRASAGLSANSSKASVTLFASTISFSSSTISSQHLPKQSPGLMTGTFSPLMFV